MKEFKLYKTIYEYSWKGFSLELEIFKGGNWQIVWLEGFPQNSGDYKKENVENAIYNKYTEENTNKV